jgi:hypothetical protein
MPASVAYASRTVDATDPTIQLLIEIRDELRATRREITEARASARAPSSGPPPPVQSELMAATTLLVEELKGLVKEILAR